MISRSSAAICSSAPPTAAGTVLVRDIVPGTAGSRLFGFAVLRVLFLDSLLIFVADDGVSGREVWKSDGTPAGTTLVKDINPGAGHSISIQNSFPGFGALKNTLLFAASDGIIGTELWKTDGTAAGTNLVKDINPGADNSFPRDLTFFGGALYFAADDGTSGRELWKSDGTAAGTMRIKDINPGAGDSSPRDFKSVNGTLYFRADDGVAGEELWKTDGTAAGTVLVKDINPTGDSVPRRFIDHGGLLYFEADDGASGDELWTSDGTEAGTVQVIDLCPGACDGV